MRTTTKIKGRRLDRITKRWYFDNNKIDELIKMFNKLSLNTKMIINDEEAIRDAVQITHIENNKVAVKLDFL